MVKLSVVLATYNRANTLPKTMRCLSDQGIPGDDYEIIVIDDASPDNTPQLIAELTSTMPCKVKFLRNEANRGAGYTQNRGIRESKAPLLLIMADDILMGPRTLKSHIEMHQRFPEREVSVLGDVIPSPEIAAQSVFLRNFDPFRYTELWGDRGELPFYVWGAANISLKREFLIECGMFREESGRAGAHCHHDVEIGYRLHMRGMKLLFDKECWGYHHDFYTLDSAAEKWRARGLNWGEFRTYMPDPEFTVTSHLFNRRTYREFINVLRRPNNLVGKEASISWHLFREFVRTVIFNGVTVPWVWRPLLHAAENNVLLEKIVSPPMYRAFLHYYWNKAVVEGDAIFE